MADVDGVVAAEAVVLSEDLRADMRELLQKTEDLKQGILRFEARVGQVYAAVMELLQVRRDQAAVDGGDDMDDDGDSNSCITDVEK